MQYSSPVAFLPCWICLPANTLNSRHRRRGGGGVGGSPQQSSGAGSHEEFLRGEQHWVTMACLCCAAPMFPQTGPSQRRQSSLLPGPSSPFGVLLPALSRHQAMGEGFPARTKGRKAHFERVNKELLSLSPSLFLKSFVPVHLKCQRQKLSPQWEDGRGRITGRSKGVCVIPPHPRQCEQTQRGRMGS